jgi:hypothetical protein
VVDRLNLYIESDNYIIWQLSKSPVPKIQVIVTRDIKLCVKVVQIMDNREKGTPHWVIAADPAAYLIGMMESLENQLVALGVRVPKDPPTIVDQGALLHVDYNEFNDGVPLDEGIWERTLRVRDINRHNNVKVANLE